VALTIKETHHLNTEETMQLRMKLAALGAAGGTALLMLAGTPALASSHASAKTRTGPEVISGMVTGKAALVKAPKVPLTFAGLVSARGAISLGSSKGKTHTLLSSAGKFTVTGTGKQTSQTANKKTCRFTFTQDVTYNVLGSKSTRAFAGASGPGAAQIHFAAYEPRYKSGPHKGQCNGHAPPLSKGAIASFLASTVLTIK
jgi:hypothetical protein